MALLRMLSGFSAGHVIGHKDFKPDPRSGEQLPVPVYYTPRYDAKGTVIAYEEPVPEGYHDLRSRGTNQNNEGVTVTVPRDQSQEKR